MGAFSPPGSQGCASVSRAKRWPSHRDHHHSLEGSGFQPAWLLQSLPSRTPCTERNDSVSPQNPRGTIDVWGSSTHMAGTGTLSARADLSLGGRPTHGLNDACPRGSVCTRTRRLPRWSAWFVWTHQSIHGSRGFRGGEPDRPSVRHWRTLRACRHGM